MGGRAEELAKKFEAKASEAAAVFGRLSEADWKKVTAAEKWSAGVTAHHIAGFARDHRRAHQRPRH